MEIFKNPIKNIGLKNFLKRPVKFTVKVLFFLFCFLFLSANALNLNDFYKLYPYEADNLFIEALSALNSKSNYDVYEIQSKNGYILFSHQSKFYLLTVTRRYQNQSEIKILPQNSDFSGAESVVKTIFSLIDNQLKQNPMEPVK